MYLTVSQVRQGNTDTRSKLLMPTIMAPPPAPTRVPEQEFTGATPLRDGEVLRQSGRHTGTAASQSLGRSTGGVPVKKAPYEPALSTSQRSVPAMPAPQSPQGTSSVPSSPIRAHPGSTSGRSWQPSTSAVGAQLAGSGKSTLNQTGASSRSSPAKKAHWADSCMVSDQDAYY